MFKNDDMDERKSIKKKRFMKKEDDLREWVGGDLDLEAAFDSLDDSSKGKITFEEITTWALMENVKIELKKNEEKIKQENEKAAKDQEE